MDKYKVYLEKLKYILSVNATTIEFSEYEWMMFLMGDNVMSQDQGRK